MKPTLSLLILWVSAVATASARSWMNTQGRVIDAEMIATDGTNISLKLKEGNVVSVALASLSAMDQAFVRSQSMAGESGAKRIPLEKRTWPETVQVPQAEIEKVVVVPSAGPGFVYRSNSFEFSSDARLLPALIKEVARTFEATKRLVEALPWGIECRPPAGMPRYLAALYETRSSYAAAGGPENSGGVYMSGSKTFRVPFESLGIKRLGESYTRDVDFSNETLVHEITHQMMHDYLPFLPQWVIEGAAEFTEMMPYKAGTFRVNNHEKGLKEYLGGNAKHASAKLPRLKELFRMTRGEWNKQSLSDHEIPGTKSRQHELYQQSALLVYYFNFLDGDAPGQGRRWMRFLDAAYADTLRWGAYDLAVAEYMKRYEEFLKLPGVSKTADGKVQYPSSLTPPLPPPPSPAGNDQGYTDQVPLKHLDLLLDGRTEEAVEQEMAAKFSAIGLQVGF